MKCDACGAEGSSLRTQKDVVSCSEVHMTVKELCAECLPKYGYYHQSLKGCNTLIYVCIAILLVCTVIILWIV